MGFLLTLPTFLAIIHHNGEGKNRGFVVKVGDMAPDFEMQNKDGTTCNLTDLRGKVVMLQFTASWCNVCIEEMPYIETDIWQKYKDRDDFVLTGIAYKEDYEKIRIFAVKTKTSYPIIPDKSGECFHKYAEKNAGVARNIIVDKSGKIVFLTRLFNKKQFTLMKKVIEKELNS
ncbi:MAG: TlpA family protein disulfide reductase [Prevotellaceae bacterium]|jgi:peroxiredoxin|nr:TlpA family protein disulfide reductase [Prevotellaceae bacterium]